MKSLSFSRDQIISIIGQLQTDAIYISVPRKKAVKGVYSKKLKAEIFDLFPWKEPNISASMFKGITPYFFKRSKP